MDVSITYSIYWARSTHSPNRPISDSEAEGRHNAREQYVALVQHGERRYCFLEICDNVCNVEFFDAQQRNYLLYCFIEREQKGRFFLCRTQHSVYDGDSCRLLEASTFYFQEDGRLLIEDRNYVEKTVSESESVIDVSANWEPYPEFGKYEGLMAIERTARSA